METQKPHFGFDVKLWVPFTGHKYHLQLRAILGEGAEGERKFCTICEPRYIHSFTSASRTETWLIKDYSSQQKILSISKNVGICVNVKLRLKVSPCI
jgi:hypothetical protein